MRRRLAARKQTQPPQCYDVKVAQAVQAFVQLRKISCQGVKLKNGRH